MIAKESDKIAAQVQVELNPIFKEALAKVLLYQTKFIAKDLEAFSKHAKRSNINTDDLKLCE